MTDNDLRMDYKRDTGLNVDISMDAKIELPDETTVWELSRPIDHEIEIYMNSIPYVLWLEEQLIKLKK